MYVRISDSLGSVATQNVMSVRRSIPVGSIVSSIRARKPVVVRPLTAQKAAIAQAAQLQTIARLRAVSKLSTQQLVAKVKSLGRIDPQAFGGLGNLGAAVDSMVDMSNQLASISEELLSIPQGTQQALGGTLLGQRIGDVGGALGLPISWQDVLDNAGTEFGRLYPDLAALGNAGDIMSLVSFQHLAAVFKDQQLGIGDLRSLAGSARSIYDTIASSGGLDAYTNIVSDAAAFGEGGLRQLLEGALGPGTDQWLTGANVQRLGNVAQGWIGAASSGSTSGYVAAVAGTLAAVGTGLAAASVAVPVGTIIAAVGAFITLLVSLLGDENPPPPLVDPCLNTGYRLNPEAWTALSMWLVAKTGGFESPYYTEAHDRGKLVQELVQEDQWLANFDPYTGEVMVREPAAPGVRRPMQRLLDVMDRNVLLPSGQMMDYLSMFERMRPEFGMTAAKQRSGGWMWCRAAKEETLTRFLGANKYRISGSTIGDDKPGTTAFRYDPEGTNQSPVHYIGGGFGWERWVSNDFFWRGYMQTMVLSMYLGGTVPYGARGANIPTSQHLAVWFSTGVGGSSNQYPIEIMMPCAAPSGRPPCRMLSPSGIWIPDHNKSHPDLVTDGVEIPFEELPSRLADQEWRLEHSVPMPSPEVQSQPSNEIVRVRGSPPVCTAQGICGPTRMRKDLAPGGVFKRDEPSEGMSLGTKVVLGAATAGLVYALWPKK